MADVGYETTAAFVFQDTSDVIWEVVALPITATIGIMLGTATAELKWNAHLKAAINAIFDLSDNASFIDDPVDFKDGDVIWVPMGVKGPVLSVNYTNRSGELREITIENPEVVSYLTCPTVDAVMTKPRIELEIIYSRI